MAVIGNVNFLQAFDVVAEGTSVDPTAVALEVGRVGNDLRELTVDFVIEGAGEAPADAADFESGVLSGSITILEGESSGAIDVALIADALVEFDEDFRVTVVSATYSDGNTAAVDGAVAVRQIQNDDLATVSFDPDQNQSVTEGAEGETADFAYTLTRTGGLDQSLTVDFAVFGVGENATDAADFGETPPSGSVIFAAGEAQATIQFSALGDGDFEPSETFEVRILAATHDNGAPAEIGAATAQGEILNDDEEPVTVINGTRGRDLLIGADGKDEIFGRAGNDIIKGLGGDDLLVGGAGRDKIFGGDGDDAIRGSADRDRLYGETGDDDIRGGGDRDMLAGGAGDDVIRGGAGRDRLYGQNDNDTLIGGSGRDIAYGGDGDDTIRGGGGRDTLYGGDGNDDISGGGARDKLFGGDGDDTLIGQVARDVLVGGDGDDFLSGGSDRDYLRGDAGDDTIHGGGDRDKLLGGDGDDELRGGGGRDELYGADGDDEIFGGAGRDWIVGGEDRDVMTGGGGDDYFIIKRGDLGDDGDDFSQGNGNGNGGGLPAAAKGNGKGPKQDFKAKNKNKDDDDEGEDDDQDGDDENSDAFDLTSLAFEDVGDVITDFQIGLDELRLRGGLKVEQSAVFDINLDGTDDTVLLFGKSAGTLALLNVDDFFA